MGHLTGPEGGSWKSVEDMLTKLHGQLRSKQIAHLLTVNGEKLGRRLQSEHQEVGSKTGTWMVPWLTSSPWSWDIAGSASGQSHFPANMSTRAEYKEGSMPFRPQSQKQTPTLGAKGGGITSSDGSKAGAGPELRDERCGHQTHARFF